VGWEHLEENLQLSTESSENSVVSEITTKVVLYSIQYSVIKLNLKLLKQSVFDTFIKI
jgi:hypothetical protein